LNLSGASLSRRTHCRNIAAIQLAASCRPWSFRKFFCKTIPPLIRRPANPVAGGYVFAPRHEPLV